MRKHKFTIAILVWLFAITTYGDWAPWVPQAWAGAIGGLMVLSPMVFFVWALGRFIRWHRIWHLWVINEMLKPGKRASE
jgi:hypothetical protein